MSEWQQVKLVDVCVDNGVQTGPFGSQLHQKDYVEVGTPIITVEHLGDNRITMQNLPRVSHEDKERLSKYALQEGDIVFSRVGSVDRRAYVRKEQDGWLFSGRCLRVRPDTQKIDPYYLSAYFGLPSFKEYVRSIAVGATMPSLNTTLLENVPIILPPKKQQELISRTAKSIEDKIELNQQMNETLEAMARALFKSWFVDFDPVRAKAEGRKPEGMNTDTSALFPAAFNDDGLPEGWKSRPLGEYVTVKRGGSPRPIHDFLSIEGLPWVKISDATSCTSPYLMGTKQFIKKEGLRKTVFLKRGALILSNSATPGLPRFLDLDACIHDGWLYFPEKKTFNDYYLYHLFLILKETLVSQGNGSVFTNLKTDILKNQLVVVPNGKTISAFEKVIAPLFQNILLNERQTQTLCAVRDSLLPKLISGELRIDDAKGKRGK